MRCLVRDLLVRGWVERATEACFCYEMCSGDSCDLDDCGDTWGSNGVCVALCLNVVGTGDGGGSCGGCGCGCVDLMWYFGRVMYRD